MSDKKTMSADETDSLIRAVAAAPAIEPPIRQAAVATVDSTPSTRNLVDASKFELARWGLLFVRRETELAYRRWSEEKAIPFSRLGMVLSFSCWVAVLLALHYAYSSAFLRATAAVLLLQVPLNLGVLLISYRPRFIRWLLPASLIGNMMGGFIIVGVAVAIFPVAPEGLTVGPIVVGFFGFTIFRLRPAQALIATLPYFAVTVWFQVEALHAARFTGVAFATDSCALLCAFASGLTACATMDRVARGAYRQERIVEAQRELIDQLQRVELQRQVAERSRGLSEALSRLNHAPRAQTPFAPGDVIEDRYRILRVLGKGGMGQVHEVERLTDGRRLALKTLTGVTNRESIARFAREAQVAAELQHPNVVATVDIGVTRSGLLFLVMELVPGLSLAVDRSRYGDLSWAALILRQLAGALATMHARGIVHRDLKPSNILLDGSIVKIADFGLAAVIDQPPQFADTLPAEAGLVHATSPALTRTGAIMGTPLYMAPELAAGARDASPSSDIFSFGVVAFELLAKKLPFAAPPVLERLGGRAAPSPKPLSGVRPDVSPQLCALVDGCLAEKPEARPTADTLAVAFERIA